MHNNYFCINSVNCRLCVVAALCFGSESYTVLYYSGLSGVWIVWVDYDSVQR